MRLSSISFVSLGVVVNAAATGFNAYNGTTYGPKQKAPGIKFTETILTPTVNSFENNNGLKLEPYKTVYPLLYMKVDTMDDIEEMFYDGLLNETTVYRLADKSIFLHRSSLNSAALVGGPDAQFALAGSNGTNPAKKSDTRWYQLIVNKSSRGLTPPMPISSCFSQEFGEGGSISNGISYTLGTSKLWNYAIGLSYYININLFGIHEIYSSVTIGGTLGCNFKKGQTGQMILQAGITNFDDALFREIDTARKKFTYREWKQVSPNTFIYDTARPLVAKCVTNPAEMQCNLPFGGF